MRLRHPLDQLIRAVMRRPRAARDEWTLFLPPAGAGQYRDAEPLRLAALLAPLAALGYELEVCRASGRPLAAEAAVDGRLELRDRRLGKRGALVLELVAAAPGEVQLASLTAEGDRRGRYAELGRYLIVALGRALPGLTYKSTYSSLSADDTTLLAASLPARPRALL